MLIIALVFFANFSFTQSKFIAAVGAGYPDFLNGKLGYQYKKLLIYGSYGRLELRSKAYEQATVAVRYNFMEYQNNFVSKQNYWTTELALTHFVERNKVNNAQLSNYSATVLRLNAGYLCELSERINFHIYAGLGYDFNTRTNPPSFHPISLGGGISLQYEIFESQNW